MVRLLLPQRDIYTAQLTFVARLSSLGSFALAQRLMIKTRPMEAKVGGVEITVDGIARPIAPMLRDRFFVAA